MVIWKICDGTTLIYARGSNDTPPALIPNSTECSDGLG
jgi:hypothetical protein